MCSSESFCFGGFFTCVYSPPASFERFSYLKKENRVLTNSFSAINIYSSLQAPTFLFSTPPPLNPPNPLHSLTHPLTPKIPPSALSASTDHFRSGTHARLLRQPAAYISRPVQAIMAALSVHRAGGGKMRVVWAWAREAERWDWRLEGGTSGLLGDFLEFEVGGRIWGVEDRSVMGSVKGDALNGQSVEISCENKAGLHGF